MDFALGNDRFGAKKERVGGFWGWKCQVWDWKHKAEERVDGFWGWKWQIRGRRWKVGERVGGFGG